MGREIILVSPVEIPSPMRIMTNENATPWIGPHEETDKTTNIIRLTITWGNYFHGKEKYTCEQRIAVIRKSPLTIKKGIYKVQSPLRYVARSATRNAEYNAPDSTIVTATFVR